MVLDTDLTLRSMRRLNSGIMDGNNFFVKANFSYLITGTDSVDNAESGDIKVFVQFRGNSILKFWPKGCPPT